jgi:antitoxin (DNA-binding transcriptional repressor) of toxin-antitoxin stability system
MSDTPEGERDPLSVSTGLRAKGRGAEIWAARMKDPGRPASRAEATERTSARHRIGIRELRQHASVYVDLAEKGYTVDITNRGRLVAQLIPVRGPGSPLERLIAAGIIEPAEEPGGVGDIEPYPAPGVRRPTGTQAVPASSADPPQAAPPQAAPPQAAPLQAAPLQAASLQAAEETPGQGRPEHRR